MNDSADSLLKARLGSSLDVLRRCNLEYSVSAGHEGFGLRSECGLGYDLSQSVK